MNKNLLLFLLLAVTTALQGGYRNTELLWQSDFSSAAAMKQWADGSAATWMPKGGPGGKPAVSFQLGTQGTPWISISLDPAKVRGLIQLEATVRGRNLAQGSKPYFGSKVMLSYTAGGRTLNPEPMRRYGTYDWTTVSMSVDEVMAEVRKDRLFYDRSGGGMTLSGGEPLARFEFTRELLAAAKQEGLHTCVETCGFADFSRLEALLPLVDLWLWDVKATGEELHRRLTGVSDAPILENLRRMDEKGAALILRCPLIPGVNDGEAHLRHVATLASMLKSVRRIDLEPYHPLGESKNRRLGRGEAFSAPFVPEERMNSYLAFLRGNTTVPVK